MDTVAENSVVVWSPEVAALVGAGLAAAERDLGRILSPADRLMFLRGYHYRQMQEYAETLAEGTKVPPSLQSELPASTSPVPGLSAV